MGRKYTHTHLSTPHISLLCYTQYSGVFIPSTANAGIMPESLVVQPLFLTLTFPFGAWFVQYSPVSHLPLQMTVAYSFRFCTICCGRRPSHPGRGVHGIPLFLSLPLRNMESCRSLPLSILLTVAIRSGVCCAQYSAAFIPATPNNGILPQTSVLHFLWFTSTILSGACCVQYSGVFVPATRLCLSSGGIIRLCLPQRGQALREAALSW